ncbi:hypothetical protein I7I51_01122 [Histoplasma capsulatum]|uniref:Uncharacterized protein n=1 Tax=Ajellomyces capsulatus TaxID=5037 RepID=A0A8A1MFY5_AJECA|nr:hypothetical protein I7I51_01122 [Histoplasma capsulatum]
MYVILVLPSLPTWYRRYLADLPGKAFPPAAWGHGGTILCGTESLLVLTILHIGLPNLSAKLASNWHLAQVGDRTKIRTLSTIRMKILAIIALASGVVALPQFVSPWGCLNCPNTTITTTSHGTSVPPTSTGMTTTFPIHTLTPATTVLPIPTPTRTPHSPASKRGLLAEFGIH